MKLTLRQLQVFDAVATHGSVTSAAQHLGMSQSTVSSTLKDLQIVLQRPLFSPHKGRHIRMTDEGRRLRASIRSALTGVEEIAREASGLLEGQITIGATELATETLLPGLCVRFRKLYPDVRINIETGVAKHLFEKVGQLDLDTAIIEIYPEIGVRTIFANVPELEIMRWLRDDLWILVSADHPLAGRGPVDMAELADWPWCVREPDSTYSHMLQSLFGPIRGRLDQGVVCNSDKALRLMAIAGGGIVCLSSRMVAEDVASGRLARLEVGNFEFHRHLCLVRPRGMRRRRIAQEFDDLLLAQVSA